MVIDGGNLVQKDDVLYTSLPCSFQDLPFELRSKIYHYIIPIENVICTMNPTFLEEELAKKLRLAALDVKKRLHAINPDSKAQNQSSDEMQTLYRDASNLGVDIARIESSRYNNTVFLLSKQISDEALNVLYGENVFRFYLHDMGQEMMENITEKNRARMRYLIVIATSWMARSDIPVEILLASIISYLRVLRIVARQPAQAIISHGMPTEYSYEAALARWEGWIRAVMEGVGRCLRDRTVLEVDVDGKEETRKVIGECVQCGFREVVCRLEGDKVHRRPKKISDDLRMGEVKMLMRLHS